MIEVHVVATVDAPAALLEQVRGLLDDAFDGAFSREDAEHALGGWHVIVTDGERPVSHAAVVPRLIQVAARTLRSGYVEAVATDPRWQGSGYGTRVVAEAMEVIRRGSEIGVLSTDRHAFYERLGWARWQGPSFVIRGGQRIRTPAEDGGIMVLRFGRSSDVSLTDPIACWSRPGDDW